MLAEKPFGRQTLCGVEFARILLQAIGKCSLMPVKNMFVEANLELFYLLMAIPFRMKTRFVNPNPKMYQMMHNVACCIVRDAVRKPARVLA